MTGVDTFIYALLGGVLPALIWLAFWLHEDFKHPEPKGVILRTFIFGMIAVMLVIPFQKAVDTAMPGMPFLTILVWVILEEIFKLCAAYMGGLRSVEDNEPIDPIIYMITAALGFVALENTLFIFGSLIGANIIGSVITGNLRFIGASLLHVVSSSIIGFSLAGTFYQPFIKRVAATLTGLGIAIAFHTIFNMSIVHWGNSGAMLAFGLVWIGVVLLLLAFEKTKSMRRKLIAQ